MKKLTLNQIKQLTENDFFVVKELMPLLEKCIECDCQYFCKPGCGHGKNLSSNEFVYKLYQAAKDHGLINKVQFRCFFCKKNAIATGWIKYHIGSIYVFIHPVCEDHLDIQATGYWEIGRPWGVNFKVVTRSSSILEKNLR